MFGFKDGKFFAKTPIKCPVCGSETILFNLAELLQTTKSYYLRVRLICADCNFEMIFKPKIDTKFFRQLLAVNPMYFSATDDGYNVNIFNKPQPKYETKSGRKKNSGAK